MGGQKQSWSQSKSRWCGLSVAQKTAVEARRLRLCRPYVDDGNLMGMPSAVCVVYVCPGRTQCGKRATIGVCS